MSRPKRGDQFTHDRFLQPGWKPGRSQTWKDAPKARMVVTDVHHGTVHYTYRDVHKASGQRTFSMAQAAFLALYGDALEPSMRVVDDSNELGRGGGYDQMLGQLTETYERLRLVKGDG